VSDFGRFVALTNCVEQPKAPAKRPAAAATSGAVLLQALWHPSRQDWVTHKKVGIDRRAINGTTAPTPIASKSAVVTDNSISRWLGLPAVLMTVRKSSSTRGRSTERWTKKAKNSLLDHIASKTESFDNTKTITSSKQKRP
jgi:hypothetical protein